MHCDGPDKEIYCRGRSHSQFLSKLCFSPFLKLHTHVNYKNAPIKNRKVINQSITCSSLVGVLFVLSDVSSLCLLCSNFIRSSIFLAFSQGVF